MICIVDGPFGVVSVSWTDEPIADGPITAIEIRDGNIVDAIRVKYGTTWGPWHGDASGGHLKQIELTSDEHIITIEGNTGTESLSRLKFHTNKGRIFGPYGVISQSPSWISTAPHCKLDWIAGDEYMAAYRISSLSFYYDCVKC